MLGPDLHKRIFRTVPEGIIQFDKAVEKIESEPHLVRLHFQDGTTSEVEFLIGTNGIGLIVRKRFQGASRKRPHNLRVIGGYPFSDTPGAEKGPTNAHIPQCLERDVQVISGGCLRPRPTVEPPVHCLHAHAKELAINFRPELNEMIARTSPKNRKR
ncbi:hypothetical protein D0862_11880 [Hortaea werneckii]|uniref:FAD-binding domain-containing protein n=1 Tax=Hortaea werneckii TaxID=91943 RepID=A0A3M7F299_HORWE|nr:hypothetical protein D0862_11880 [Hortaea werneckii]